MVVGSRNRQGTVRDYCPWLVKANGISFIYGGEDVSAPGMGDNYRVKVPNVP